MFFGKIEVKNGKISSLEKIQSGIKEVIYLSDKYAGTDTAKASRLMLNTAGVTCRKVETNISRLELSFNEADV